MISGTKAKTSLLLKTTSANEVSLGIRFRDYIVTLQVNLESTAACECSSSSFSVNYVFL
ncbi:hypothetical protein OIU76_000372 [Salix suchowensis]|nr:hypothetical protein OIU76_000372 [Salix suchowensis]